MHTQSTDENIVLDILDFFISELTNQPILSNNSSYKYFCDMRPIIEIINNKYGNEIKTNASIVGISDGQCNSNQQGDFCFEIIIRATIPKSKDVNWGRFVTIFAFSKIFLEHCIKEHTSCDINQVKRSMAIILENHLGDWLKDNGGWERLHDRHPLLETTSIYNNCISFLLGLSIISFISFIANIRF